MWYTKLHEQRVVYHLPVGLFHCGGAERLPGVGQPPQLVAASGGLLWVADSSGVRVHRLAPSLTSGHPQLTYVVLGGRAFLPQF